MYKGTSGPTASGKAFHTHHDNKEGSGRPQTKALKSVTHRGWLERGEAARVNFSLITPVLFKLLRQDAFYFIMKIKANKVL